MKLIIHDLTSCAKLFFRRRYTLYEFARVKTYYFRVYIYVCIAHVQAFCQPDVSGEDRPVCSYSDKRLCIALSLYRNNDTRLRT